MERSGTKRKKRSVRSTNEVGGKQVVPASEALKTKQRLHTEFGKNGRGPSWGG